MSWVILGFFDAQIRLLSICRYVEVDGNAQGESTIVGAPTPFPLLYLSKLMLQHFRLRTPNTTNLPSNSTYIPSNSQFQHFHSQLHHSLLSLLTLLLQLKLAETHFYFSVNLLICVNLAIMDDRNYTKTIGKICYITACPLKDGRRYKSPYFCKNNVYKCNVSSTYNIHLSSYMATNSNFTMIKFDVYWQGDIRCYGKVSGLSGRYVTTTRKNAINLANKTNDYYANHLVFLNIETILAFVIYNRYYNPSSSNTHSTN